MNTIAITTPAITAAAHAVAAAGAAVEHAAAKLGAARERIVLIDGRIAGLDEARADIVARRQRGEQRDDDAAMLALNQADREGLVDLRLAALADEVLARDPHDAALRALDAARYQLGRAEAEEAERALVEHATHLDTLLLRTVVELDGVGRKLDRARPAWVASSALRDALRTLAVHAGVA